MSSVSCRARRPGIHHPDLTINYRRVTVVYTTHSDGGLTEKDLAGARTAESLGNERSTRPTA